MREGQDKGADFNVWFEEMAHLAQHDPQTFESRRQELIEEAITQAPPDRQKRLRALQWRIDMERQRAKTPLGACLKIYDMLWDFIYAPGGFLEAVEKLKRLAWALKEGRSGTLKEITECGPDHPSSSAKIIPFPKAKRKSG